MGFVTELRAQQVGDNDWRLLAPLVYEGHTDKWTIKEGFETDFASSPAVVQWLVPRSGRYAKAAVLHDYFWRTGGQPKIPRSDADGIFRRVMSELSVPFLLRWVMWAGVRAASLFHSHFSDGPSDIPKVALIIVAPGSLVIACSIVVSIFLLCFLALEYLTAGIMAVLRATSPGIKARTKEVVTPRLALLR
jgi:hypothetical protein